MSLITINADFSRVADALERIARAVEDFVYEPERKKPAKPADLNDYSRVTDDDIIARQREEERLGEVYGAIPDADEKSTAEGDHAQG